MGYSGFAIDCSPGEIDGFCSSVRHDMHLLANMSSADSGFFGHSNYGGVLGSCYSYLEQNLRVLKEVADASQRNIAHDDSVARQVISHNKAVREKLLIKLEEATRAIGRSEEAVKKAHAAYKQSTQAQTSINATRKPNFPNTAEGNAAKAKFEKELANAKSQAASRVSACASNINTAEKNLADAKAAKARIEDTIKEIDRRNKELDELIMKLSNFRRDIAHYVSSAESALSSVKDALSSLADGFSKTEKVIDELIKKAEVAKGYAISIAKSLAKASEASYGDKICIRSPLYLTNMAEGLSDGRKEFLVLSETLLGMLERFSEIMQDGSVRASAKVCNAATEHVDVATEDFDKKAGYFNSAANALYSYMEIS